MSSQIWWCTNVSQALGVGMAEGEWAQEWASISYTAMLTSARNKHN